MRNFSVWIFTLTVTSALSLNSCLAACPKEESTTSVTLEEFGSVIEERLKQIKNGKEEVNELIALTKAELKKALDEQLRLLQHSKSEEQQGASSQGQNIADQKQSQESCTPCNPATGQPEAETKNNNPNELVKTNAELSSAKSKHDNTNQDLKVITITIPVDNKEASVTEEVSEVETPGRSQDEEKEGMEIEESKEEEKPVVPKEKKLKREKFEKASKDMKSERKRTKRSTKKKSVKTSSKKDKNGKKNKSKN